MQRTSIVRVYLAALLLAMAAGQLLDVGGFVDIIETYQVGSGDAAWFTAIALVVGEVTGAVGLLGRRQWRGFGATVTLAVAVGWTVLAVQAFGRGLEIENCGCFGVYLGQELRWYVLAQDAGFVAAALWIWIRTVGWRAPLAQTPPGATTTQDSRSSS